MTAGRPTYTQRIIEHIFLTPDVVQIRLEKPDGFTYLPGQFVQLIVPETEGKVTRSYSLSSTPTDPWLEWCIKIIPGGVTDTYIQHLRLGDQVVIRGPFGLFTPKKAADIALVGTGAGLTPLMSIMQALAHREEPPRIHLWFGVRTETDIFWLERLETLARDVPQFSYTLTLSQSSTTWNGLRGRVTDHLNTIPKDREWFLCGSLAMVKDVRHLLEKQGVAPAAIHQEIF